MTDLADHVAAARAALARTDDRAALAAALAAWRIAPHRKLAEVVVRLGQRVAQTVPPLVGTSLKIRKRVWFATLHKRHPDDLDHLLATIDDTYITAERLQRLDELAALPADPRIALRFLDLAANPRFDDQVSRKHAVVLAERLGGNPYDVALPPDPAVDALHAEIIDPAAEARDLTRETDLLAAVYAAPTDDAPRSIYADWLLARGDPRGELIALQLAPSTDDTKRRAGELVKTYGDRWIGRIAAHLQWPSFERGFLAACHPKLGANGERPPSDIAWSTLTRCAYHFPPLADARGLRETSYLDPEELAYFATFRDPPALATLELNDNDPAPRRRAIAALGRAHLPSLRHLVLMRHTVPDTETVESTEWPWRSLALDELSLTTPSSQLGAWHAAIATSSTLRRLHLRGQNYSEIAHLTRDAATASFDKLVLELGRLTTYDISRSLAGVVRGLESLPRDALRHIEIQLPNAQRIPPADLRSVVAAVDRQTHLVTRAITHREK